MVTGEKGTMHRSNAAVAALQLGCKQAVPTTTTAVHATALAPTSGDGRAKLMLVPTVVAVAPSVVFVTSVFVAIMMIVPAAEVPISRSVVAAARVAAARVAAARVAAARVAAARVAAARVAAARVAAARVVAARVVAARVAAARVAADRVGMVHLSCFDVVGREVTICGAHVDVDLFAHSFVSSSSWLKRLVPAVSR